MNGNIIIEQLKHKPVSEHVCEFVERKGLGHPDYMIDSACEAASVALSKYYL
ncbi:MAG: methionine adenosyltransferase, partial [Nitrososphaerota archaeon]